VRIWLVKDGEQLPIDGARRLRTGMLSAELASRGHEVTWWSSTFSHQKKARLSASDAVLNLSNGETIRLLEAGTYATNVSTSRYRHHQRLARRLVDAAAALPRPDAIVVALPTIDLAFAVTRLARQQNVPVIVDVRDLWPDVFREKLPGLLRFAASPLIAWERERVRRACARATGLVASSEGYLQWALRHASRPQAWTDQVFYIGAPKTDRSAASETSSREPMICTFVGSFGRSYNLSAVCEAAARLADREDIQFVVAGDGEQRSLVEAAASSLPRFTYAGWLSAQDTAALLARTHVGLVPCISLPDTMPNKFFEYLAAGLPQVSSLTGETEAALTQHDAGIAYSWDSADQLTTALRSLADDRARLARMSSNARRLFAARFDPARIYPAYANHVEAIAQQRGVAA